MKSWDDDTNFIDNDLFRSLAPSHLWRMLSTTMINVWEPTAWLLKALVYAVFGLSPRAFRIASLVFHWLNAVLAAIVAERLLQLVASVRGGGSGGGSGVRTYEADRTQSRHRALGCTAAAAVFAAHPVNVEVIGWCSCLPPRTCTT